jgi:hypothetical protein
MQQGYQTSMNGVLTVDMANRVAHASVKVSNMCLFKASLRDIDFSRTYVETIRPRGLVTPSKLRLSLKVGALPAP